jgi:hypothetical protein
MVKCDYLNIRRLGKPQRYYVILFRNVPNGLNNDKYLNTYYLQVDLVFRHRGVPPTGASTLGTRMSASGGQILRWVTS